MKYHPLERLGGGASGEVVRAFEPAMQRYVALKWLKLREDSVRAIERFREEGQIMARFDHPHIVKVYEADVDADGRHYIAMQFVEGGALSEKMSDERMRRAEVAVQLMITVARAVDYANKRGVIHCDIKPANILIHGNSGAALVTDFGISQLLASSQSSLEGTQPYKAPEQCGYHPVGGRKSDWIDVYGLGAVLYELLTGVRPYEHAGPIAWTSSARKALFEAGTLPLPITDSAFAPYALGRKLDAELQRVIEGALQIDCRSRYPSAELFARDLERWLRDVPVQGPKPDTKLGLVKQARHFWRRNHRMLKAVFVPMSLMSLASWAVAEDAIGSYEQQEAASNLRTARFIANTLSNSIRESKQHVISLARERYAIDILKRIDPGPEPESWIKLVTSLKKAGVDQFYVLDADGCILRYWPEPPPLDVYRYWYGFRYYFECGVMLDSRDRACITRAYASEYDHYANTLRSAISAPVYDPQTRTMLGVVVASSPADRTFGTLTFGSIPESSASTSLLILRDLDRVDATPYLQGVTPPVCTTDQARFSAASAPTTSERLDVSRRIFGKLQRSTQAIVLPRDGLGTTKKVDTSAITDGMVDHHYKDPRDQAEYLAAFAFAGSLPPGKSQPARSSLEPLSARPPEALPIVVAATRRDTLQLYAWQKRSLAAAFCFICLVLGALVVFALARRDGESERT